MRSLAVLVGALIALLTLPALALGDTARVAANSQTYQDVTGEDPAGPDITTTVVSNDDAGAITFQIAIPNRPSFTADMLLLMFLDTVPGAGDADSLGADYAIQLVPEGAALFKWNGSDFRADTPQRTLTTSYAAGATIGISAAELGAPKTINFLIIAISGIVVGANGEEDFSNIRRDIAPTGGFGGGATTWSYEVRTVLALTEAGFTTSPSPARAGAPFSAAVAATRNDTQGLVRSGTVTCQARIGSTRAALRGSRVQNGVATCSWAIPKTAKGKTIRGTVTLTVDGARLTRSFSARIS